MAFVNDSVGQSPPSVGLPPSRAASDSQVDLPLRVQKTLDSDHTITQSQETTTPLQQAVGLDQTDDARQFLQYCLDGHNLDFPDRPREFIVPELSFDQLLEDSEFESLSRGFKISYNSHKCVLTLSPMPGRRHGRIIEWLGDVAKQKLDSSVRHKLCIIRGEDIVFQGEWGGSHKEPDLGIAWIKDVGGTDLHTVVEVGVSQSRQSLLNLRDLYLRGTSHVSRLILVDLVTDPEYTSPVGLDIRELRAIDRADFQLDSDQGPLWYKGVKWVGKSTLVWEVWERNLDHGGEPTQIFSATIDAGDCETRLPFFEIPATTATGIEAVTIAPADLHEIWQHWWKHAIIDEAVRRMGRYVENVTKRRNNAAELVKQEDEAAKREEANKERTERANGRSQR
ncbi:hypothetical protein AYO20_08878 [Fonsecaea nubica]|uniref:Uncharacterized protein n=1 Tax=Fonsecaea nubica TaxID=856822 RepID=A0A178CM16_9EURO|nr:hypothetical protein AYO20_08878 [Fonsecaea nubica]OAL30162.1 hypothetical protein AYO20_08878 [Fonsecaea nubica]